MTRYVEIITDCTCTRCVGCGVDVTTSHHTPGCPQTTGVWPVTYREVDEGATCTGCRSVFRLGEHYTRVGVLIVCLGCAAVGLGAA